MRIHADGDPAAAPRNDEPPEATPITSHTTLTADISDGGRSRLASAVGIASIVVLVAAGIVVAVAIHRPQQVPVAKANPSRERPRGTAPATTELRPKPPARPKPPEPQIPDEVKLPPPVVPTSPTLSATPPAAQVTTIDAATEPARYPPLEPGRLVYREYHLNKIHGFSVYINRTVFDESQRADGRPLDVLQGELERLSQLAPKLVKAMQTVKVFVEWDHVDPSHPTGIAVFYGGRGEGLLVRGISPLKAGQITLLSLKTITEEKTRRLAPRRSVILLHEMAHAAHHYDLGDVNPFVENAYHQAMSRGLYQRVPDDVGGAVRAYAAANSHEYFAEITCAYLDRCTYFPHDREQLKDYDSVGYELARKVWGEPEATDGK
jgi:hypothetical protein